MLGQRTQDVSMVRRAYFALQDGLLWVTVDARLGYTISDASLPASERTPGLNMVYTLHREAHHSSDPSIAKLSDSVWHFRG